MLNLKPFQPAQPLFMTKFQPPREWLPRLRALLDAHPQDDLATTEALCCRIVGNFTAGMVLHKLLYWITRGSRDDGAIWKSDREWRAEFDLSYSQMQRVRAHLKPIVKIWKDQAQGAPTHHYQLRLDALVKGIATVLNCSTLDVKLAILDKVENRFSAESKNDFRESRKSITNQTQAFTHVDERLKIFNPYLDRFSGFNPEISAKLAAEHARIGESNVRAVLERCNASAGKTWQYVLRSLENVSAPVRTAIPLYDPPPAHDDPITDKMRLAWASSEEGRAWASRLDAARKPKPAAPTKAPAADKWSTAWDRAFSQLEIQLDRASFDTWLRAAKFLKFESGVYYVAVPNTYARDMLQHRLYRDIRRTLSNVLGAPVELTFEVHKPAPVQEYDELPAFKLLALQSEAHEAEMAFYKSQSSKEVASDMETSADRRGLGRNGIINQ